MDITEEQFDSIKQAQADGITSQDVSKEIELAIVTVNNVFGCLKYDEYLKAFGTPQQKTAARKQELVSPARAGYYKALIAAKVEENEDLKERRGWLLEQVYFLRKAVAFLERRKRELEDGIDGLQKNITLGISMMEQIENNDGFKKLSDKTNKRNE